MEGTKRPRPTSKTAPLNDGQFPNVKLNRPPHINIPASASVNSSTDKKRSARPGSVNPITSTPSSTGTVKGKDHCSQRPCQEHSFLTDVADVRQMEQGLLKLLDDFHLGHLQAFSEDCAFQKMDQVREQQERLARLHFELDGQQEIQGIKSSEAQESANRNLGKLMDNLQTLCTSIQNLQQDQPASQPLI